MVTISVFSTEEIIRCYPGCWPKGFERKTSFSPKGAGLFWFLLLLQALKDSLLIVMLYVASVQEREVRRCRCQTPGQHSLSLPWASWGSTPSGDINSQEHHSLLHSGTPSEFIIWNNGRDGAKDSKWNLYGPKTSFLKASIKSLILATHSARLWEYNSELNAHTSRWVK